MYMYCVWNIAIEAMKNAHKEELEKNQRSQLTGLNSDIDELRLQYEYGGFFCLCWFVFNIKSVFVRNSKKKRSKSLKGLIHKL